MVQFFHQIISAVDILSLHGSEITIIPFHLDECRTEDTVHIFPMLFTAFIRTFNFQVDTFEVVVSKFLKDSELISHLIGSRLLHNTLWDRSKCEIGILMIELVIGYRWIQNLVWNGRNLGSSVDATTEKCGGEKGVQYKTVILSPNHVYNSTSSNVTCRTFGSDLDHLLTTTAVDKLLIMIPPIREDNTTRNKTFEISGGRHKWS